MSCAWDLWCLDCEDGHGFDDSNHQDRLMVELAKLGPELAKFAPTFQKIREMPDAYTEPQFFLQFERLRVNFEWFAEHGNHRLIARDEYGRNIDECTEQFACPVCKHAERCRRPRGHAGEHAKERDDR